MVTKFIPHGYVNNYDKNRYLDKLSKAAVLCTCAHLFQKRQLGELFGAGTLNNAFMAFIQNREIWLHQNNTSV